MAETKIKPNMITAQTVSRALVSDASGFISPATTTATEIGYVNGVTSAIQTQLGTKLTNPMTTGGDVIYGGASGAPTRLANGSSGQVLTSAGTTVAPTWSTPAPSSLTILTATSAVKTPTATSNFQLLTSNSITLTAGTWDIWGTMKWYNSGSPAYSSGGAGIFSTNGGDNGTTPTLLTATTNLTVNSHYVDFQGVGQVFLNGFTADYFSLSTPSTVVTVAPATTVTIYITGFSQMTTPANARCVGQISGRKIYA